MMNPPIASLKPEIYIRECYPLVFQDILDLSSAGKTTIHVSGNPGIGKSCFLWYVATRLCKDPRQQGKAIVLELVSKKTARYFVITPERTVQVSPPNVKRYLVEGGTWLLTDQKYIGSIAERGTTVVFASPKVDNWDEARRTNERVFRQLLMPTWSLDELKAVFFRGNVTIELIQEFWTRYYIFGPVVRWYFQEVNVAFPELAGALDKLLELRTLNATLFTGGVDNGLYSHKIFCFWPSADFSRVARITFLSEFMEVAFAIRLFRRSVSGWVNEVQKLAADPTLRSAAGSLFERYAHYRLSCGGTFPDITNPEIKLILQPRRMHFFNGNRLRLESASDEPLHKFYLRPNSTSFPLVDGIWLPNVLFQVSIAKRRKAMEKADFESLCAQVKEYMMENPDAKPCVEGAGGSGRELWTVLVKMQGDNSTQSTGLTLVEDLEGDSMDSVVSTGTRKRRKCASTVKQVTAASKRKPRRAKFPVQHQMTIVLGEDPSTEHPPVDYKDELRKIYDLVNERIQGDVDQHHLKLPDYQLEELDDHFSLLLRGGKAARQYIEEDEDDMMPAFGVWITAEQQESSDGVFTTSISMECTEGTFLDQPRELTVFINDRIGVLAGLGKPVELVLSSLQSEVTSQGNDTFMAKLETETKVTVLIRSMAKVCKLFTLKTKLEWAHTSH